MINQFGTSGTPVIRWADDPQQAPYLHWPLPTVTVGRDWLIGNEPLVWATICALRIQGHQLAIDSFAWGDMRKRLAKSNAPSTEQLAVLALRHILGYIVRDVGLVGVEPAEVKT